jgi:hypothetical protein
MLASTYQPIHRATQALVGQRPRPGGDAYRRDFHPESLAPDYRRRARAGRAGRPTAWLRMQLLKPLQSLRLPPRAEFRLQTCTFHAGGLYLATYFKAERIARCWVLMQRLCHRHTKPILRRTGSVSGGDRVRAPALADQSAKLNNNSFKSIDELPNTAPFRRLSLGASRR